MSVITEEGHGFPARPPPTLFCEDLFQRRTCTGRGRALHPVEAAVGEYRQRLYGLALGYRRPTRSGRHRQLPALPLLVPTTRSYRLRHLLTAGSSPPPHTPAHTPPALQGSCGEAVEGQASHEPRRVSGPAAEMGSPMLGHGARRRTAQPSLPLSTLTTESNQFLGQKEWLLPLQRGEVLTICEGPHPATS